jgi:hypothetical protein
MTSTNCSFVILYLVTLLGLILNLIYIVLNWLFDNSQTQAGSFHLCFLINLIMTRKEGVTKA